MGFAYAPERVETPEPVAASESLDSFLARERISIGNNGSSTTYSVSPYNTATESMDGYSGFVLTRKARPDELSGVKRLMRRVKEIPVVHVVEFPGCSLNGNIAYVAVLPLRESARQDAEAVREFLGPNFPDVRTSAVYPLFVKGEKRVEA
ncbi:MAG: hypothetical protein ABIA93_07790 [Candidatus Woesearchaeota archaeon]